MLQYRYETHLHTLPVSKCAHATVEENVMWYKKAGYDGIFVTNHFLDGNINVERDLPYADKIEFYFSDYEKAVEYGQKIGLKVFLGVELSYKGTDFLIYGLDKRWFLQHPEIMEMEKKAELALMMEAGALIIQAHPFREAAYIDHIRLFPRSVHGVEIINACRNEFENKLARQYAENYDLIPFAGSDNHRAGELPKLAGMCCNTPIENEADFIRKVKNREMQIFFCEAATLHG